MMIGTGLKAILYKEFIQVRRDPATKFVFLIPIIQLIVFGYALDTDIRHIPTVVYDRDRRSEAREFLSQFENTDVFNIVEEADSVAELREAIVAGRAHVGIILPPEFSDHLVSGRTAQVRVVIDGTHNNTSMQAINVANGIALHQNLEMLLRRTNTKPQIDLRPYVLFNENLESAKFFVPGLVGIIMQLVTVMLTAFSIVRERERGTLEQLMVTPVSRSVVTLGKLIPFAVIGFVETCFVLMLMVFVFEVPIVGSKLLLLSLSALFLLPSLGMGLLISTAASNQGEALQLSLLVMLPSILLSGFVFPLESMPLPIRWLSHLIPVTYYIMILRGIILRGATAVQLWLPATVLIGYGIVLFVASALRFQKRSK